MMVMVAVMVAVMTKMMDATFMRAMAMTDVMASM